MDKRIELYWVKKYPDLFAGYHKSIYESAMPWGFACGNGWFDILDQLWRGLSSIEGIVIGQVKEKLAGLRVYLEPMPRNDKARELVHEAYRKASETCEMCGKPGERRGGSWLFTLCDDCEILEKETKWEISEQLGNEVAKKLGLRTECEIERDHVPNFKYDECIVCGAVRNRGTNFKWFKWK